MTNVDVKSSAARMIDLRRNRAVETHYVSSKRLIERWLVQDDQRVVGMPDREVERRLEIR